MPGFLPPLKVHSHGLSLKLQNLLQSKLIKIQWTSGELESSAETIDFVCQAAPRPRIQQLHK
eukprot:scaffold62315_cov14-Tisochrysis_lutea.AAC.1